MKSEVGNENDNMNNENEQNDNTSSSGNKKIIIIGSIVAGIIVIACNCFNCSFCHKR